MTSEVEITFQNLAQGFEGSLFFDENSNSTAHKLMYSTDASVYQEIPLAVAIPKTVEDIKGLIKFANDNNTTLLPRAGGTSLAGQVVGNGIVVDISKHFNKIVELNTAERWVRVQPGVIRNDLNAFLKPHGLLFGPETSTASRAMIGGMIGNNSSGLHSIVWGDTRSNLLEVTALLADGSTVVFKEIDKTEFDKKCIGNSLEANIYRKIAQIFSDKKNVTAIIEGFPKAEITRRNTGYALDILLKGWQNIQNGGMINPCHLLAGSEGTLCFILEAKLKLLDVPAPNIALVNIHCHSFHEATLANLIALKHKADASEFLDELSITLTEGTTEHSQNRSWVVGNPKAVLMVEFFSKTEAIQKEKVESLIAAIKAENIGYEYVTLYNEDTNKAWELRKASLGILSNQKGDTQPVNLIEDVAVTPEDLPAYIAEIEALLQNYNLQYSIAAHAGAGELHVLPMMNVRTQAGKDLFRKIALETVPIIKKYKGSLSGEHGDGRLRGEFIPAIMGEVNYGLFKDVKAVFDPKSIFNQGKITDSPSMNAMMRVQREESPKPIHTIFDFTEDKDILRLAEKCSGSGDCRKTHITGGTMCPSFMATGLEEDSTRARANMLRHYYSPEQSTKSLIEPTKHVLDRCLSCKGCKSECPSSVDVGKMKAEFTQQYIDTKGTNTRSWLIGNFNKLMTLAAIMPQVYNLIYKTTVLRKFANKMVGFHPERSMPLLANETLKTWHKKQQAASNNLGIANQNPDKKVFLFADEFTNFNDVEIGKKAIQLLQKLGYEVHIPQHVESARSYLSKGFVKKAKQVINKNIELLQNVVTEKTPLIGIEPSAILGFRDEYLDLALPQNKTGATHLSKNSYLFEEWFAAEIANGNIKKEQFTTEKKLLKLHGHCHQKALSNLAKAKISVGLPANYEVQLIPSGCCGMAGSFGYEAEHYVLSQQIAELVLYPTIRQQASDVIIVAAGTSCRHQIKDGLNKKALHPIEVLWDALV